MLRALPSRQQLISHSHLLARRGLAQRIGNLLGQLQFSDDQLQKTQKGLNDAGVPMPNFGDVGRELAKEINEDPEIEIETEDERKRCHTASFSCLTMTCIHPRARSLAIGERGFHPRFAMFGT